jgi:hypothetical protein
VAVVFILACIGAAGYFFKDTIFPSAGTKQVDMSQKPQDYEVEAVDPQGITTVSEYSFRQELRQSRSSN